MNRPPKTITLFQVGVCLSSIRKCQVNKTIDGMDYTPTTCPKGTQHMEMRDIGENIKTSGDRTFKAFTQLTDKFHKKTEVSKISTELWDEVATEMYGLLIWIAKNDALLKAHHLMQNPDSLAQVAQGAKLAKLAQDLNPPDLGYPEAITQYKMSTLIKTTPYREYIDEPYALAHAMELNAMGLPILIWEITASSGAPNGNTIKGTVPVTPSLQTWTKHILNCESNSTTEQMLAQMTQQGRHTTALPAIRALNTMPMFIMEAHITHALPPATHHKVHTMGNSPQNHTDLNCSLREQSTMDTNQAPLTMTSIKERAQIDLVNIGNTRTLSTPTGSMETIQHLVSEFMTALSSPDLCNTVIACPLCKKPIPQIRRGSESFDFMKHLRGHHKEGINLVAEPHTFLQGLEYKVTHIPTSSMDQETKWPDLPTGDHYARHHTIERQEHTRHHGTLNFTQSRAGNKSRPYRTATTISRIPGPPPQNHFF